MSIRSVALRGDDGALRFPRARFTRALSTLCEKLDGAPARVFFYKSDARERPYWATEGLVTARAKALWAFGSWARGAPTCGDLDLLAKLEWSWAEPALCRGELSLKHDLPRFGIVWRALAGRAAPYVHVLDATGDRTLGQKEAALIWTPGSDWRAAMEAIQEQPGASRAPRFTDPLPLRLDQTTMDLREAEDAVHALHAGLLKWEFKPHPHDRIDQFDSTPNQHELSLSRQLNPRNADLALLAVVATRELRRRIRDADDIDFIFGKAAIWPGYFLKYSPLEALVITPTWSRRGPNGSLIVTRGSAFSEESVLEFERTRRERTDEAA